MISLPKKKFVYAKDEIAYIREALSLGAKNEENIPLEVLAEEFLSEYETLHPALVLHPMQQMTRKEMRAFTEGLIHEPHNRALEEMLGFLIRNGIKNTLILLDEVEDPRLARDFHAYLVAYIAAASTLPKIHEMSSLSSTREIKLYEICIESRDDVPERTPEDMIARMTEWYAAMSLHGFEKGVYATREFTLEYRSTKDGMKMYAGIPAPMLKYFTSELHALFPEAKLILETYDPLTALPSGNVVRGTFARTTGKNIFDSDISESLTGAFLRLHSLHESALMQIVIDTRMCLRRNTSLHRAHMTQLCANVRLIAIAETDTRAKDIVYSLGAALSAGNVFDWQWPEGAMLSRFVERASLRKYFTKETVSLSLGELARLFHL